uniref:ribonuclease H n=1 Tax=Oncorhynchus mykiss TaxID=8022 RepID=A0A8C7RDQ3_ONCMY
MAILLDNLLAARGRSDQVLSFQLPSPPAPIPMELGGAASRGTGGGVSSCTSCGRRGHTADRCWTNSSGSREGRRSTTRSPQVSKRQTHPKLPVGHMYVLTSFPEFLPSLQHKALVDSGAAGNFMDRGLALRLGIPLVSLDLPFPVHSLDSRPLGSGVVREATVPLDMVTQGGHEEQISLFLIDSPVFPVVLGIPWLAQHNPVISWRQGALKGWSEECSGRCIGVAVGAINLLENAALPRSHVYPLSNEETVAMETYVAESLGQGYIRPSASPISSSFFFVKKDGGLRPCIDYRGLNSITAGFSYPLPLIAAALESFHGVRFFTKLDLRSANNLVRIRGGDEWKTAFSTTSGHYEYRVMPYGLKNAPAVFRYAD